MTSPRKTMKISVVYMGRERDNNRDVKEFILELEPKTRILNIFEYLHEIGKIKHIQVSVATSKGGNRIPENFTIEQAKELSQEKGQPLRFFMYDESPTLGMLSSANSTDPNQSLIITKEGSMIALNSTSKQQKQLKVAAATGKDKQSEKEEKACCCSLM